MRIQDMQAVSKAFDSGARIAVITTDAVHTFKRQSDIPKHLILTPHITIRIAAILGGLYSTK